MIIKSVVEQKEKCSVHAIKGTKDSQCNEGWNWQHFNFSQSSNQHCRILSIGAGVRG